MKRQFIPHLLAALLGVVFTLQLHAQTTAFTYQGQLVENGMPANGVYDLKFELWQPKGSVGVITNTATIVSNGLFTVILDFGGFLQGDVFTGDPLWLEIGVATNGTAPFVTLSPRQPLTSAPYAIQASTASSADFFSGDLSADQLTSGFVPSDRLSGTYSNELTLNNAFNTFSGTFAGDGSGLSGINALDAADGVPVDSVFVDADGNVGIGTVTPAVRLEVDGVSRMYHLDLSSVWGHLAINGIWDGDISAWRRLDDGYSSLFQQSGSEGGLSFGVADTGSAGEVLNWRWPLGLTRDGDVIIDAAGASTNGTLSSGLKFGWSGSGEGIASKRNAGGNEYGLDFYTDNQPRLSLLNNGDVGIGTSTPRERLEVEGGNIRIQGADGYDEPGESAYLYLGGTPNYIKATRNFGMNLGVVGVPEAVTIRHNTGYVGIGITNPATALQVVGTVTADGFDGPIAANQLTGTIATDTIADEAITSTKILDGSVIAADVNTGSFSNTFWTVTGNDGTTPGTHFLGTKDNQPLEFKVNGQRGLRIESTTGAPNLIGGSSANNVSSAATGVVIAGGDGNDIGTHSSYSAIGGGSLNKVIHSSSYATIAGGRNNDIGFNSGSTFIGGGYGNTVSNYSSYSTIAGGSVNNIADNTGAATIAGGHLNDIGTDCEYGTIGGGRDNNIADNSWSTTIAGGYLNDIGTNSWYGTISGGRDNNIADNSYAATIAGGADNEIGPEANYAFAAGRQAKANHQGTFIWADSQNAVFASSTSNQFLIRASGGVGIGTSDPGSPFTVQASVGTVLGGVPGFKEILALFRRSAGGHAAISIDAQAGQDAILYLAEDGLARWGIRHDVSEADELDIRFEGTQLLQLTTNGDLFISGTVNPPSDRNLKQAFSPVDPAQILAQVTALPIQTWVYKSAPQTTHLGPVAQDFYAAFRVGPDDKHISTVDADGVALAAIQGLNQKVEAQRHELNEKQTEITELKQTVNELKELVSAMNHKLNGGGQ